MLSTAEIDLAGIAQVLIALSTLVGVLGNLWMNRKIKEEVRQVKDSTNGMTTQLVETTAKAAKAEGKEEQKKETQVIIDAIISKDEGSDKQS